MAARSSRAKAAACCCEARHDCWIWRPDTGPSGPASGGAAEILALTLSEILSTIISFALAFYQLGAQDTPCMSIDPKYLFARSFHVGSHQSSHARLHLRPQRAGGMHCRRETLP